MNHRVLVAFVDALGPAQVERFASRFAAFPERRALDGVLGYSSGALATVLTGAPPAAHGRMCLFSINRAPSSFLAPLAWLGLLPRPLHQRTTVRRAAAALFRRLTGTTGYLALHRVPPSAFRWLDVAEREDLFAARDVGGAPTFLARARQAGLSVYASPWQLPERERWEHADAALTRARPDLTFLYAAELDAILHSEGNDGAGAARTIEAITARISRVRDRLGSDGASVTTLIVGDHGMADVRRVHDPRPLIRHARRHFVDSTMLRLWGRADELARARLALERARIAGAWLDGDALAARAAPAAGAPYGDAIFVLDEGAIFAPSFVGGRVAGMHGYDLSARSCRAALVSDAPLPSLAALTDVAPEICRRLGLP